MGKQNKLVEAVKRNVKAHPMNISAALRLSATETGCTYKQAQYVWYGNPQVKDSEVRGLKRSMAAFITVTADGILANVKNSPVAKATKRKLQLEHRVDPMGDISTAEKVAFFDMVFK